MFAFITKLLISIGITIAVLALVLVLLGYSLMLLSFLLKIVGLEKQAEFLRTSALALYFKIKSAIQFIFGGNK